MSMIFQIMVRYMCRLLSGIREIKQNNIKEKGEQNYDEQNSKRRMETLFI